MKKVLLLLSGGPDSSAAAYILQHEGFAVACLTLLGSTKTANHTEVTKARALCEHLGIEQKIQTVGELDGLFSNKPEIAVGMGGGNRPNKSPTYGFEGKVNCVPIGRTEAPLSMQFLHLVGAMYASANNIPEIIWAVHQDDNTDNWVEEYIKSFNTLIKISGYKTKLTTPFSKLSKRELIQKGQKQGLDVSETFSCLSGGSIHCGKCTGCKERNLALQLSSVEL